MAIYLKMVPSEGLEPPRREALGSKPSVATNYTNWACRRSIYVVDYLSAINFL